MKTNQGFLISLKKEINKKKSHLCVGLDTDFEKIPAFLKKDNSTSNIIFNFNKHIIDKTADCIVAYKLNTSFYAAYGIEGLKGMLKTNLYIRRKYPFIKIIADSKRSEMLRSAEMVAKELFNEFLFDSFTSTPWFGFDTLSPYISYKDKAVFILCHDSNPSSIEVQDIMLKNGLRVYEAVTDLVCKKWNKTGNILIEAPLTFPKVLHKIIARSDKDQFFLLAGLGAQKGNIADLKVFKSKKNFIINASRSIIFASDKEDFAAAARLQVKTYNDRIYQLLYN